MGLEDGELTQLQLLHGLINTSNFKFQISDFRILKIRKS